MSEVKLVTDSVRNYAKEKGVDYTDIGSKELYKLWNILNESIKNEDHYKSSELKLDPIKLSKISFENDGTIKSAFLSVSSNYFKCRECISFNSDGFIGFAGWASSDNIEPIVQAFIDWVDTIKPASEK